MLLQADSVDDFANRRSCYTSCTTSGGARWGGFTDIDCVLECKDVVCRRWVDDLKCIVALFGALVCLAVIVVDSQKCCGAFCWYMCIFKLIQSCLLVELETDSDALGLIYLNPILIVKLLMVPLS